MRWWLPVLIVSVSWLAWLAWPDNKLHIVFCDVGQGDATILIKGSVQVLVDGGPSGDGVLKCLDNHLPFWDRRLETVVLTHAEKDHVGGLDDVAERFTINTFVESGIGSEISDYQKLVASVAKQSSRRVRADGGDEIRVDRLTLKILSTNQAAEKVLGAQSDSLNESSLVGEFSFGKLRVLLTGDIGEKQELALVQGGVIKQADVIKVPHHGSKFSSSDVFIQAVSPRLAVVSVGKDNRFRHPAEEVLIRYDTFGSSLKRTDKDGEVEVISDGNVWWVKN